MKVLCECSSPACGKLVEIPPETVEKTKDAGYFIIAANCHHGPDETDELVSEGDGYKTYAEKTAIARVNHGL